ncbi:MAG TPA: hypothetical protein VF139_02300 [Candidatus Polarisedimenticolaceae bacterium]
MKRMKILAAAAALLGLAVTPVAAQTAEEIVGKYHDAMGGVAKVKSLETVRMTGKTVVGGGQEAGFILERKRPSAVRSEIEFMGTVNVQAFDGESAWQYMPVMGMTEPEAFPPEDSKEAKEQADFDGPLVDWKEKGVKLEYLGKEAYDGKDCHKLRITEKDGSSRIYFLDVATNLLVRETAKAPADGGERDVEVLYRDWRDVGGFKFPFELESRVVDGPPGQLLKFEKIEPNVPLDAARFKMPPKPAPVPEEK